MSELGKATPEQVAGFQSAVRENPGLIGEVLSRAIDNGVLIVPDDSHGVSADQLLADLEQQ